MKGKPHFVVLKSILSIRALPANYYWSHVFWKAIIVEGTSITKAYFWKKSSLMYWITCGLKNGNSISVPKIIRTFVYESTRIEGKQTKLEKGLRRQTLARKSRKHGYAFLGYPEKENKNEKKKDISIKSRGQCKRNATEYFCFVNSLTMTFNSNANDLLCH